MKTVAFVPIKSVSERLWKKNTRDFARIKGGLSTVKLKQLQELKNSGDIDNVVVSTDDYFLIDFIAGFNSVDCTVIERPVQYRDRDLPTRLLHQHAVECLSELGYEDDDLVMWAQVTNPLFGPQQYCECLRSHQLQLDRHDSLQSVTATKGFFRFDDVNARAINWSEESQGNWPRSQTMKKVLAVDSACSLITLGNFKKFGDRIGSNPYYFKSPGLTGWDIDTADDFLVAELLYKADYLRQLERQYVERI